MNRPDTFVSLWDFNTTERWWTISRTVTLPSAPVPTNIFLSINGDLRSTTCFQLAVHVWWCQDVATLVVFRSPICVLRWTISRDVSWYSDGLPINQQMASNLCRLSITCREESTTFEDLIGLLSISVVFVVSLLIGGPSVECKRSAAASIDASCSMLVLVWCLLVRHAPFDAYWGEQNTRQHISTTEKPMELTLKLRSIVSNGLISPRSSWHRELNSISDSTNAP